MFGSFLSNSTQHHTDRRHWDRKNPHGYCVRNRTHTNGEKVRFYNAVDLINVLIKEQAEGRQGNLVKRLQMVDCVIIDELGYIPFSKSGGAL